MQTFSDKIKKFLGFIGLYSNPFGEGCDSSPALTLSMPAVQECTPSVSCYTPEVENPECEPDPLMWQDSLIKTLVYIGLLMQIVTTRALLHPTDVYVSEKVYVALPAPSTS
jgi:hypothetical protein